MIYFSDMVEHDITHSTVGFSNLISQNSQYRSLFKNRRLPDDGWSDIQIQHFLYTLSSLDTDQKQLCRSSNNSKGRWCGVGEREGRVYSSLLMNRHFGLSHGIGRSGDISEAQPKATYGKQCVGTIDTFDGFRCSEKRQWFGETKLCKGRYLVASLYRHDHVTCSIYTLHHNLNQLSQIEKKENKNQILVFYGVT